MRFLANENFPRETIVALTARGHDVTWVRRVMPGAKDRDVLLRAQREERILLTFDKDFGELAFRYHLPAASGVVLFRIPMLSPGHVSNMIVSVLESRLDWAGHFSVVDESRIRMVPRTEGG